MIVIFVEARDRVVRLEKRGIFFEILGGDIGVRRIECVELRLDDVAL